MQTRDGYDNDNVRRIFEAIARDTIDNAGGTYQHRTGATVDHTDGYYVGVGNVATVDVDASTYPVRVAVVAGILADTWPHTLPARAQYVGTCIDGYNRLYVDYTTHIPGAQNLDVALACARRHGELAVWDCKNGVAIGVPIITDADARECFADDITTLRAIVDDALTSTDADDHDRELRERLLGFIDATADIDPNLAALEVRDLIEELHTAVFGEESIASIVNESGDIVADTWIVERLRVLTDSEYAERAYGADDYDDYDE